MTDYQSTVFLTAKVRESELPKLTNVFGAINNRFAKADDPSPLKIVSTSFSDQSKQFTVIYSVNSFIFDYLRSTIVVTGKGENNHERLSILSWGIYNHADIPLI